MENLRRQLHKGTKICSSIELLGIGEAVRETEEEVEETLLFKLFNGTDVDNITEAKVATRSKTLFQGSSGTKATADSILPL